MENQPLAAQMEAGRSFYQNHFETWHTGTRCYFQKGLRLENNLSHCFATLQEAVYDQDFFMSEIFLIERKESRPQCVDHLGKPATALSLVTCPKASFWIIWTAFQQYCFFVVQPICKLPPSFQTGQSKQTHETVCHENVFWTQYPFSVEL